MDNPVSRSPFGSRLWGYGFTLIGTLLFATKGVFVKLSYALGIVAIDLLVYRMLMSLPFFLAVGWLVWRRRPIDRRPSMNIILKTMVIGMLGYWVSSWLDFKGLIYLTVQHERLILFTYPFMTFLFAAAIFGHRLQKHALIGAAIAYAGLACTMFVAPGREDEVLFVGGAFVLGSAVAFGLYQVLANELIAQLGSDLFTAIAMTGASLAIFAHRLVELGVQPMMIPSAYGALLIVGLGIVGTVLPAFAMAAGMARIGAQGVVTISSVSPMFTTVLGILILNESFSAIDGIGMVMVMVGVGYYTLIDSRNRAAALI